MVREYNQFFYRVVCVPDARQVNSHLSVRVETLRHMFSTKVRRLPRTLPHVISVMPQLFITFFLNSFGLLGERS